MPRLLLSGVMVLSVMLAGCSFNKDKPPTSSDDPSDFAAADRAMGFTASRQEPGLLQRMLMGDAQESLAKIKEAEGRIAALERELRARAAEADAAPRAAQTTAQRPNVPAPWTKAAVLYPTDGPLAADIGKALAAAALDFPLSVASSEAVQDQITASACTAATVQRCLDAVARYPGAQVLAVIAPLTSAGDKLKTQVQLYDTIAGHAFPPVAVDLPAVDGKAAPQTLDALADQVYLQILQRSRLTPWSTRVFEHQGQQWFVSAGSDSGLKTGDRLQIHAPGRVIASPSGSPAGWIPGPRKGALEIVSFFGDDLAIARLVEGQPPTPDDPLLLDKR